MKIGPVTLTRDSAWWGVSAVLSFAAVLATFTDTSGPLSLAYYGIPASWLPYIRLLGLFNTWLSGKMANSPAPSSGEVARGLRDNGRSLAVLLAFGLALGAQSCATLGINPNTSSARHLVTVTVVSGNAVLGALQDGERGLVCGTVTAPAPPACVPVDRHKAISADFVKAFQVHRAAAQLVRDTPAGAPTPSDLARLLGDVNALIESILARVPASTAKAQLISKAQAIGGQQ